MYWFNSFICHLLAGRQEVRQRSCSASRRQKQIRRQEKLKAWERPDHW
jgi:hypothetical protein